MKKTILISLVCASIFPAFASIDFNQKYGNVGAPVFELQDFLYSKGFLSVNPTGFFGLLTLNAVKAYQGSQNLPITGFVGPLTREAINGELSLALASSTVAEVQETGTTTAPVYVPTIQSPTVQTEPTVQAPVVVQSTNTPTMEEISYGTVLVKPDINTDGTTAWIFFDQSAQEGDVVTVTYNGTEKTMTLADDMFKGRGKGRMASFVLATDLTPNTTYDYTVKTVRGMKFAQGAGTFSTK